MKKFIQDDCGATAIEFCLIASLIAVAIVGMVFWLGDVIVRPSNHMADVVQSRPISDRSRLLDHTDAETRDVIGLQACKNESRWTSARFETRGDTQVLVLGCGGKKGDHAP